MVFLINGIPVLVIECKNADKDEAIAIGIDKDPALPRRNPRAVAAKLNRRVGTGGSKL